MSVQLFQGDCLEIMPTLPAASVDLVLCDLPYGTTACKWDTVIPFVPLWEAYWRLVKEDKSAVVLFGSEPFSTKLRMSALEFFRYDWVWQKDKAGNFASSRFCPQKTHEIVSVFGRKSPRYNPQMQPRPEANRRKNAPRFNTNAITGMAILCAESKGDRDVKFPTSVQYFNACREYKHPTQKPLPLVEYLIKTYTNPSAVVLDNCMGSGTTGVACVNTGRNFIGIEKDANYFQIAQSRISAAEKMNNYDEVEERCKEQIQTEDVCL